MNECRLQFPHSISDFGGVSEADFTQDFPHFFTEGLPSEGRRRKAFMLKDFPYSFGLLDTSPVVYDGKGLVVLPVSSPPETFCLLPYNFCLRGQGVDICLLKCVIASFHPKYENFS